MIAVVPCFTQTPNTDWLFLPEKPGHRAEWENAKVFLADNSDEYFQIVFLARLAGIGWSVLAACLIFHWACDLYGPRAGMLSIVLWCFGPYALGHASLAAPDVPTASAGLAATYAFRRYLRSGSWGSAAAAGLLLGVAQLTKFTLLVLYPVWAALAIAQAFDPANTSFRAVPWRKRLLQQVAIGLLSVVVLNLGYAFDGTGRPLGGYEFVSRTFRGPDAPDDGTPGNRFRDTLLSRFPVPLPADYLLGIDIQRRDFEANWPSYLRGEWRNEGWWYYYLYALAVKVPLGTLALALWALALTLCRHRASARWADELTLWLPAVAVLALVSSQTGFNHHSRYALPALPFLAVATGKVAYFLDRSRWRAGLCLAALLVWSVVSSLSVYPHSLSYFNELAGGPDRGHEHLIDSNIDWGQDLFFFKRWTDRHPEASPIGLAYFNFIDYRVALKAEYPEVPPDPGSGGASVGPHPGWWAVDVYSLKADSHKYFERFHPVAKAGYSIFIYHITPEEADQARHDMGLPPLEPPAP
jgi:hypothetical protein